MNEYKIYVLKSTITNEVSYVGLTINKLSKRLNCHYCDVRYNRTKNLHKINWFNKYNNTIIIEQIDSSDNKHDAFEKEKYWISKFRNDGIILINKTNGGEGCFGYKHNKETILKISGENNHRFGKKHTKEWILDAKNRIPVNKGIKTNKPAHNRGVAPSDITIEKIRNSKLGSKLSDSTIENMKAVDRSYKNKKIEALIDKKWIVFDSMKDASVELKLNPQKISLVCSGKRKSTGGLFFRYFGSNVDIVANEKSGRCGSMLSVLYNGVETIYSSITEASKELNINRSIISRIINGRLVNKYINYKINLI